MADQIRKMVATDWPEVRRIYQEGLDTNMVSFQDECLSWEEWDASHRKDCRLVITTNAYKVFGWIALTAVSSRCVYDGVAEVSIYVDKDYWGHGAGKALLSEVIRCSEQNGLWTLEAGIMQENTMSICLFKSCGFRTVGFREKLGRDRYGIWRNVVLMERRSTNDLLSDVPMGTPQETTNPFGVKCDCGCACHHGKEK